MVFPIVGFISLFIQCYASLYKKKKLRLLLDAAIAECFLGGGRGVFTQPTHLSADARLTVTAATPRFYSGSRDRVEDVGNLSPR